MKKSPKNIPAHETVVPILEQLSKFEKEQLESQVLACLPALAKRWLPDGRLVGCFWSATSPNNKSRSISIDLRKGSWREFPTGRHGKTTMSLAEYLTGLGADKVQEELKAMIGSP
jgi:hypothetical protein